MNFIPNLYGFYCRTLANIGAMVGERKPERLQKDGQADKPKQSAEDVKNADQLATEYGNLYRGLGVLMAFMGILVVLLAVLPTALVIKSHLALQIIGVLKVFLMGASAIIFFCEVKRWKFKERWVAYRKKAEAGRYALAWQLIHDHDLPPLRDEIARILDEQVEYNHRKSQQYEHIEHATSAMSGVGFAVAFGAASWLALSEFHLAPHNSALILGTAFVPALIGGLHGLNAFLNVGNLAEEHKELSQELGKKRTEFIEEERLSGIDEALNSEELTKFSTSALHILNQRDDHWAAKAKTGKGLPIG